MSSFSDFWSQKMLEHLLFLDYLLVDPDLQFQARRLMKFWQNDPPQNKEETNELLQETRNYQAFLLENPRLSSSILPLKDLRQLLEHMLLELDYFSALLNEEISPLQEAQTLAKESAQHDRLALASLVKPPADLVTRSTLVAQALDEEASTPDSNLLQLLAISNSSLQQADQQISSGQLKSILPQAMLEHEISEGLWSSRRLAELFVGK